MNFKKSFSLICLSACFLSASAQEIDIESLYRSSALPTGNALLAAAAPGTSVTTEQLQSDAFWRNTMGWSISNTGSAGNPWLIPSGSGALPYQRTSNEAYTPGSEVSISTKAEFLALQGAYKPYKITLKDHINLEGDTLYSLSSIKVFDGGGYTISNFNLKKHPNLTPVGVFSSIDTVRNLTVKIKSVEGTTYSSLGVLVGHLPSGGLIENCHVSSNTETVTVTITGAEYVGGLVGFSEGKIVKSSVKGINVTASSFRAGGLVGYCAASSEIDSCEVESSAISAIGYAGGIAGINLGTCKNSRVTHANLTANYNIGGIAGHNDAKELSNNRVDSTQISSLADGGLSLGGIVGICSGTPDIKDCKVDSVSLTATGGKYIGGIVGYSNANISLCSASRITISGKDSLGGLVGAGFAGRIDSNIVSNSNITGTGYSVGGLVGGNNCALTYDTVYNVTISALGHAGGLIGYSGSASSSIDKCRVYAVDITATYDYVGGIAGTNLGTCKNSRVTHANLTARYNIGGIAGENGTGELSGNMVDSTQIKSTNPTDGVAISLGGIVGLNSFSFTLRDCKVDSVTLIGSTGKYIGGIVGYSSANISLCSASRIKISGKGTLGGLVGLANLGKIDTSTVINSEITGTGDYVGGLVGENKVAISDSKVDSATVTGVNNIGGLVGFVSVASILTSDTVINSKITGNGTHTGGLLGCDASDGLVTVNNCRTSLDTVLGNNNVGGFVGTLNGTITGCKVDTAYVNGSGNNVGGLVGESKRAISYSKVDNATVKGANNSGGLVGYVSAASTLASDTVINSKITATVYHAGGLVGCDASDGLVTVTDCRTSLDTVIGKRYVAGFVSRLNGSVTRGFADSMVIISSDVDNSCAGGIVGSGEKIATAITGVSARHISVTASGPNAGGIAGYTLGSVTSSKVDTSSINGTGSVGGIVGYLAGTAPSISSCSIDSVRVFGSAHKVGGIVGCNEGNLLNDTVSNSIIISGTNASKTGGYLGGISGHNKANIVGCVVRGGSVDLYLAGADAVGCGGIAGFNDATKSITSSMVLGTKVTLTSATAPGDGIGCGGIVGRNEGAVSKSLASSVTVTHSREGNGTFIGSGGIAGFSKGGSITQCLVKDGTIDGQCYIGGVLGRAFDGDAAYNAAINNCHVHNSVISSSNTTDNTHMGGIVGKHQGSVEKCLVTNIIFRNYNTDKTKVAIGGILAVIGGATTIQDNVAMIDYFDIRAKFTKGTMNLSRISGGKASDLTLTKNLGWVETYVKYYHKKFGLNWVNDFYKGTGHIANNLTNGDNLFAGDKCATAGYSSNTSTPWATLNFSSDYWNFDYLASYKFAVLKIFKDSTYAPLVANRGNEYMEKVKNTQAAGTLITANPLYIFSPALFITNSGFSNILWTSATQVNLYTDILLEEDDGNGSSTFWAIDPNASGLGNISHNLIHLSGNTTFELNGHGYSIDGYNNPYTGTDYGMSSLILSVANCAYTVKRLEVANYNRTFNDATNTDTKRFGALIDKVSGVSTFEDIYIKNPKIQVTNFVLANIGGLVGDVSNNITANRLVVYMTATDPLKSSFYGCLGGFFGEVSSGANVAFNNVASYSVYDFSAGSGSNYGYYIGKGTGSISNGWFGTAVLSKVGAGVPASGGNTAGSIFDALTGASITNGTVWHIPASTVSTDSIYLVRDTIADDGWSGL